MFSITGITGRVGGAAASGLLAVGRKVQALVRDPQKGHRVIELGSPLTPKNYAKQIGEVLMRIVKAVASSTGARGVLESAADSK